MHSSFRIFRNPITGEFASLFIHNITNIIVTDSITIHCPDGNTGYKTLEKLGFTEDTKQGAGTTI